MHTYAKNRHVGLLIGTTLALIGYVAFLGAFSKVGFPTSMISGSRWPSLIDKPVGEDGYYMLTVADNIATKGRISYNGGLPATGIQPLATLLFAALTWVVRFCGGDSATLIRGVLGLGVLLFVVFAYQVSRITASLSRYAWCEPATILAFLLTLSSYTLFRLFTYGLETGLYLIVIASFFQITLRICQRHYAGTRETVLLGLAAGFAGEARIDFGLVFAIVLVILLLYRWISLAKALAAGVIALVVVSPWFWFVHRVSGSWLPTSGKAESTLIAYNTLLGRLGAMAIAIAGEAMPWCYAVVSKTTTVIALLSGVAVICILVDRKEYRNAIGRVLLSSHSRLWLVCLLSLAAVYLFLFNATHFYYRYVAPLSILAIPACAICLAQSRWVRHHLTAVATMLVITFTCWSIGSLHTGHIGNSQTISAGYVHRYFPETRVGAFQSGVMGFFNPNVENLDGKLNQGALKAIAERRMPDFIDHEHINVLVDWPSVLYANLPAAYLEHEWQPCPVPIGGGSESICLIRKRSDL